MRKFISTLPMCVALLSAVTLQSCSNSDSVDDTTGNKPSTSALFAPAKSADVTVYSGSNTLFATTSAATKAGAITRAGDAAFAYYKVQDYQNTTKEHMPAAYAAYVDNAPKTTDRGEWVSQAEYDFVINYLKEHPNEGSTTCDLTSYFIQNVGSSKASYTTTDWNKATHTITGGNQMDYMVINSIHINDYNATGGPRALVLNLPVSGGVGPQYHDSYGDTDNMKSNLYRFYLIEYNGTYSYYLCFDYATHKNSGNEDLQGDGIYNDWVIKLTPADGSSVAPGDNTSTDNGGSGSTVGVGNGSVEVNFSINDQKSDGDYIATKLSIHVRDYSDVSVFIPVEAAYYCAVDDMYIVQTHREGDYVYNNYQSDKISMDVNGTTVTLTVTYETGGIRVTTDGINQNVIDYLREKNGDGINFEVWNYYKTEEINRTTLKPMLDKATIKFLDTKVGMYINAFGKIGEEDNKVVNPLDCEVKPEDTSYSNISQLESDKVRNIIYKP